MQASTAQPHKRTMLTPLELDIMKAVWRLAPVTVRDVQNEIRPSRNLAYTTVLTMMDRLYHKGFVTRTLQSRTHLYEPAISYAEVRDEAVRMLLEHFFDGSKEKLREYLNGSSIAGIVNSAQFPVPSSLDETLL